MTAPETTNSGTSGIKGTSDGTSDGARESAATDTPAPAETVRGLHELLDERQRYEGWLAGLEQRKSAAPSHVYERVYADYSERLNGVMERLSERTEQLQSTHTALTTRLGTLKELEAARTEARQEAELRALVGEYTDEEWNGIRDEADLEIALIAEDRAGIEQEMSELQRIIALTRPAASVGATASATSGAMSTAPAETAKATSGTTMTEGATASETSATADAPRASKMSMNDLFSEPALAAPTPRPAPQGDGTPSAPKSSDGEASSASARQSPMFNVPPLRTVTRLDASVEPRHGDQDKSLKCPECGTMNYATEWYCERCGGELATF